MHGEFSIRFEMKRLRELNHFLGLEVEKLNKEIFISEKSYAEKFLKRFGVNKVKMQSISLDNNERLKKDEVLLLPNPRIYRALVGSLIYLTITKPNISFFFFC